jgi:Na+/H+ antiporter NhaD/arsenite permease-like protein
MLMLTALILFLATYAALLALPKLRAYIALLSAALFVVLGILPVGKVLSAVDWNVLMMIAGTMGIVYFFIESKMPSLLADIIIARMPNVKWIIIALSLFAGIISAFVDNVATVLMVAPVALVVARKLEISPVPSIIAIAISSNLQGAATLVGDTTSILLGGYAGMDFLDFFVYRGRPGLFWVVQIGALVSALVLLLVFRKDNQKVKLEGRTDVEDFFPTVLLVGTVLLLIVASFVPNRPQATNGLICMALFLIGLVRESARSHNIVGTWRAALKEIDYFTLLLLGGLFVVIGGITEAGVVDEISRVFVQLSGNNLFAIYSLLVWASVLFSAFIDNIPYIATMLPVTAGIAEIMGVDPTLLYFGLLVGATLGGNLTPIGASANITALGILRKNGYEASTGTFMRISVPFTLSAVVSGYILVWLLWK